VCVGGARAHQQPLRHLQAQRKHQGHTRVCVGGDAMWFVAGSIEECVLLGGTVV
jgi:hypothetical protein